MKSSRAVFVEKGNLTMLYDEVVKKVSDTVFKKRNHQKIDQGRLSGEDILID
jgi:hypothetical protein